MRVDEILTYLHPLGGSVTKMLKWKTLAAVILMGSGLVVTSCKSAPDLTKDQALALVQAKYDQTAPAGVNILVNDPGMMEGATAKLWARTKVYPNKLWADFTLTPDGKKVVTLPGGGDVIQWRPDNLDDKKYSIIVTTTVANHLKAKAMGDPQDEMIAGADTAKGADYTEGESLAGVPQVLQDMIANNPENKVSAKKHADFALANGTWSLKSIQ